MPAKCQHWRIRNRLALTLILVGGRIEVTRRTLATSFPQVTMTAPDGSARTIDLKQTSPGLSLGVIDIDKRGLYRFDDGTLHLFMLFWTASPAFAEAKPLRLRAGRSGSLMRRI